MINLLFIIALNFTAAMAEEANLDLKNQCAQNQEKSAWIKNQLEAKGYSVNQKDAGPLYLDLGTRNEVLVLWVNPQDCVAVLQSFEMLEKIKKNNMLFQGVSVVYSDQFKFTKISLKDFSLPLNVSINSFLKNLEKLDKNPIEALDLSMLSDDFKKINPELKKIVDEKEINSIKSKVLTLKDKIKSWGLDKAIKFKEVWQKQEPMKILNSKVQNYHDHIVIYDKLKKGQWEEVQKELEKQTVPLSTQLKQELQKGKSNLESILKQAKADILKLEKEIQDSFKNKKQTIEGYEI